jgi:hypothetical protein
MGYMLLKYIFRKAIIKAAFIETTFYPFNLKNVFNKLSLLYKAILKKNLILKMIR